MTEYDEVVKDGLVAMYTSFLSDGRRFWSYHINRENGCYSSGGPFRCLSIARNDVHTYYRPVVPNE